MQLDTTLKNISISALFLVLLVPLVVTNDFFFPFITGKNFLFRILVEVAFAAYVLLSLRSPQYRTKFSYIAGSLAAFLVVMGLATVFAENPFKAFWSNFERMEGYITLLHLGAYFVVLSSVLTTEKLWMRFFTTSVAVSSVVGLLAISQLIGWMPIFQGQGRVDSTLGNAAYLAVYMLLHLFITLFLIIRSKIGSFMFYALLAAFLLQGLVIYHTGTRGALLGLVLGGFVAALIALWGKEYPRVRLLASGILVLILILVGGVFVFKDSSFVSQNQILSRMASISLQEGATRFTIWGIALEGFKERPLLGWGQEGFNFVFNKYYKPELWSQEPWFDRAHSVFLDWLIAGGLLGFLGYLSLYACMLYLIWKGGTNPFTYLEKALFTGMLLGYFVNNLFVFDNIASYLVFFALLAYVHFRFAKTREWKIPGREEKQTVTRIGAPVIAIVLVLVLYFGNVESMRAAYGLIRGIVTVPGGLEKNLEYFKSTLALNSLGLQEAREQVMQRAILLNSDPSVPLAVKQEFFTLAKQEMEAHVKSFGGDARTHVFYGSFLRMFGQIDESIVELTKAHELSPGKQTILIELALSNLAKGDVTAAITHAKEAYDLDTRYDVARVMYAAILMYGGKQQEADRILIERFDTALVDNEVMLQAYADTKQFGKFLEIWKARIQANPKDPNIWVGLANAFMNIGDKENAIKAVEEAVRLKPELKAEADAYIKQIKDGKK